jgi:hypothetical protein
MKHLRKFENYNIEQDNSKFRHLNFEIPDGEYDFEVNISELIGKVVIDVKYDSKSLTLVCSDKENSEIYYTFYHEQDCCESVWLEDIVGDLSDLIPNPILKAEVKENVDFELPKTHDEYDSSTNWTFYTLATFYGYVDLRFFGTSNGYYSTAVSIMRTIPFEENKIYS